MVSYTLAPIPVEQPMLIDTLADIAKRIRERDGVRRKIAEALAELKNVRLDNEEILEPQFVKPVDRHMPSGFVVAGVDGGLLEQQLFGLDLILLRAVAVIFRYRDGELDRAEYFPGEMHPPRLIDVEEPLDSWEFELLAGMERQLAELELAAKSLQASGADFMMLDGSIVPQYTDRLHNSKLLERYGKLLEGYTQLYEKCRQSETLLAGVVKDSRSGRFIEIMRKTITDLGGLGLERVELETLERSRDAALLDRVLGVGERTFIFRYAGPSSFVLRDLGEWAARVYVFYIKSVPFDCPLRVEFIDWDGEPSKTADRVASIIYALSSYHESFGLPSVLIEADACARLSEDDLCIVRDSIADYLGPSVPLYLRRQRRPF